MSTDLSTKLTEAERRKFNDLDGIVVRGKQTFAAVGAALCQIRDQRLYREEWGTFEDYCEQRHGWSRQRAYQLIAAHGIVAEMSTTVDTPPENESQARALVDVPPKERVAVFEEARQEAAAEGKPVTAKRIRDTAHRNGVVTPKPPRKSKAESPLDMAAAIVKAAEKHRDTPTEADGRVDTPPVTPSTEASSEAAHSPRASSATGSVVLFVRALEVPCFRDVEGMTDADAEKVALWRSWCGDVLEEYRKHRRQSV